MHDSWRESVVTPRSARGFFVRRLFVVGAIAALILAIWQPLNGWADVIAERITNQELRITEGTVALAGGPSVESSQPVGGSSATPAPKQELPPKALDDGGKIAGAKTVEHEDRIRANKSDQPSPVPVVDPPSATVAAQSIESSPAPQAAFRYQLTAADRSYMLESQRQLTVLGLMEQLANQGFSYTAQRYDYGVFITGINGVANDPSRGRYWTYAVNGQSATVGADQYQLKDGDMLQWAYPAT